MRAFTALAFCWLLTPAFVHGECAPKSAGCGRPLADGIRQGSTGQSNNITFVTAAGYERSFLLHIPTNYDVNAPRGLILSFHGRNGNSSEQEVLSQFSDPEFNPDMLAVYPQGILDQWQGDPEATTDDVSFTLEMISNLTASYCINEDQIFAAGKSNGGGFTASVLACDPIASVRIAAFASASGAYYQGHTEAGCDAETVNITCTPGRSPIPIIETHGGSDATIPYEGGPRRGSCLPSVPYFLQTWAELDGLRTRNDSTELYNDDVIHYVFGNGSLEGVVQSYYIPSLDHIWPSTEPNPDSVGYDTKPTYFNATSVFMEFFGNWTLERLGLGIRNGSSEHTTCETVSTNVTSPSSTDTGDASVLMMSSWCLLLTASLVFLVV